MPPPDVPLNGMVVEVKSGEWHTCVLLEPSAGGGIQCWGDNTYGQLGLGHSEDVGDSPGDMPPLLAKLEGIQTVGLSSGEAHTCAISSEWRVYCWGDARFGQSGPMDHLASTEELYALRGFTRTSRSMLGDEAGEMPPLPLDFGGQVTQVSAGGYQTCVVMKGEQRVRCIGDNRYGMLGYGDIVNRGLNQADMPPPIIDTKNISKTSYNVRQVLCAKDKTCVILITGEVNCWGLQEYRQLGNNELNALVTMPPEQKSAILTPTPPIPLGAGVDQICAGHYHVCVVLLTKKVICWGLNQYGEAGAG
eukprot:CAMPEP_0196601680 /NCGR_PEP_ID=MMETSP1081-20130531/96034_1 /TAXON_ID=36882 /ORGANISM="Pyramimonas amylifera, Strain CCMP720" /LENGTH=304 /DNA_ID=CAMNT_0041927565 /DNA_START=606 /DNA_END=1516 /DNA_ORIENTATION=-